MRFQLFCRQVCVAMALTACTAPIFAQTEVRYRSHVTVGGHAGMTMSQMSFSPTITQKWHQGMQMGVSVRYQEEKIFGLIGELNFVQRGWNEDFRNNPELSYKRTLNYITLPILTHICFGGKRFKGFVNLGPEFAYMLGDNISANFDYNNPTEAGIPANRQTEQLWSDVTGHFDYGITAGLGAEFWVKPRHSITFEVRFYYGLGNIFPSARADTFSASRTMSLGATFGYNFRLK